MWDLTFSVCGKHAFLRLNPHIVTRTRNFKYKLILLVTFFFLFISRDWWLCGCTLFAYVVGFLAFGSSYEYSCSSKILILIGKKTKREKKEKIFAYFFSIAGFDLSFLPCYLGYLSINPSIFWIFNPDMRTYNNVNWSTLHMLKRKT